jgi:protein-L-isoaspartate(D-aspartate) O-methyltransferase
VGKQAGRFPVGLDRLQRNVRASAEVLRPQRPLEDAARDAGRRSPPSGLVVERLRADGIRCQPVLNAFATVPRHRFVDTALANQAYEDTSLPIGHGQTISKPSVVARMLSLLFEGAQAQRAGTLGRVLEIGTGCGYQTALLALMSARVLSVERLKPLHEKARLNLDDRRPGDVRLVWGDGRIGHAPNAPYDSIVAAAGGDDLPPAWTDQLAEGGRLVAPVHDAGAGGQMLLVVDRRDGALRRQLLDAVHFVPLKSGTA